MKLMRPLVVFAAAVAVVSAVGQVRAGNVDDLERYGFGYIDDRVGEVSRAARQNFRAGATKMKKNEL